MGGRAVRGAGGPALVAALTFAYLIAYPLVIGRADESHLLHGARRVYDGQVLYRDFFEIITPLGFYFIAAAYRIGGVTLLSARVAIALVEALGAAALFVIVRRVAGKAEALLAVLVFAGLCIPVWPYASAHWMSTTLGLVTAAVVLAETWQQSARARAATAGALCGIAICVQQQRGVFLFAWVCAALPMLVSAEPPDRWRTRRMALFWVAGGAAAIVLVVLGHAAWAASPAIVVESLYGFAKESYGPQHVGTARWAGVLPLTGVYLSATWLWLLRVAPLFLVGEGFALARHLRQPWSRALRVRAACWLLALFMALSVCYLPDFIHVSFVMPFLAIPAARLLRGARRWPGLARVRGGRGLLHAAMIAAIAALAIKAATNLAHAGSDMPLRIDTAFGTLQTDDLLARLFQAVRRHLVAEPTGRSLVYSYPDDAWLYLALPADDATRFEVLVPTFPKRYLDEVVAALRARRPGTVVLLALVKTSAITTAVDAGYDLAEEVPPYRIYVRRAE